MALHLIRTRVTLATCASWLFAAALAAGTVAIFVTTGCANFFVPPTTSTGTTGTTGTTGSTSNDYAFFANSASGSTILNGYTVTGGTLTATTSSPYALGIVPQSMAINPANIFLYIASDSNINTGAIYGFSLSTTGKPSILNSGSALASENSAAIAISPDGKYLFSLNAVSQTIEQYSINTSTGFLTSVGNYPTTPVGGVAISSDLRFAPSGTFLVAAYGTGGAQTFGYNTSTGALTANNPINTGSTTIGIFAVAVDSNNYVYVAGTNSTASPGLQVFSANSAGVLGSSPVSSINTGTSGNAAKSIVINSASTYVYTGNFTDGTISAFAIGSGGKLTAVSGSPFTAPTNVSALARDNSGSYILAEGYSASNGIQVYSIGSTGVLTATSGTAATGTSGVYPAAIAASH